MIDFTELLQALIGILTTVITVFLIPWIRSKTTLSQQAWLDALAYTAVTAAEKQFGPGKGQEKLEYVQKELAKYKIKLDAEQLRMYIESAVQSFTRKPLALEVPPVAEMTATLVKGPDIDALVKEAAQALAERAPGQTL